MNIIYIIYILYILYIIFIFPLYMYICVLYMYIHVRKGMPIPKNGPLGFLS